MHEKDGANYTTFAGCLRFSCNWPVVAAEMLLHVVAVVADIKHIELASTRAACLHCRYDCFLQLRRQVSLGPRCFSELEPPNPNFPSSIKPGLPYSPYAF